MPQLKQIGVAAGIGTWLAPARWIAFAAILLLVVFADVPGNTHFASTLQNSAHAPAFALLFLLIVQWIVQRDIRRYGADRLRATARPLVHAACLAFAITLALGVATEAAQWLIGRDAEAEDIWHDACGAGSAAAFWLRWQLLRITSSTTSTSLALVGFCCIALWLQPLIDCGIAYRHRANNFPVIAQFTGRRDLYFTETHGAPATLIPARNGQPAALEIALEADRWPGVTLNEPVADWLGYGALVVQVSIEGSQPVKVNVRVDDTPDWHAEDSFTGSFMCAPGTDCVHRIALDALQTPLHRKLDVQRISRVIVFHGGPLPATRMRIHRVWLARSADVDATENLPGMPWKPVPAP